MTLPTPRTDEERRQLDAAMARLRDEWGFPPSYRMADLLNGWQSFVVAVEDGYELSLYDYMQSLALRDAFEQIKKELPARLAEEIQEQLTPLDQRLRFATEPAAAPLAPGELSDDRYWWQRVPKRLTGQLLDELIARGLK